jgi:tetratricopeptide (TPR) repeat protein
MKKYLLAVSLLLTLLTCLAQSNEDKKLFEQLKQHPQQDTFRVNRLNDLAAITSLSPGKADSLANEALLISQKIGYVYGEANSLINKANFFIGKGDKQKAFDFLQKAGTIAKKINDNKILVKVLMGYGQIKAKTAENKQSLEFYLKAASLAEKIPDKRILAKCQRTIASVYHISLSDYPKSMEWNLKAIKTAEEADCLDCLAQSWTSLAALHTAFGDHEKSLLYYKKALDANKKLGNKIIQSHLLNSIGERYRYMGKYTEALKAYQDALLVNNTPYDIELNESNIADVYVRLNNLPVAFKYDFKSLQIATSIEDTEGVSWIDGILGRAYLKKNNADSAIFYGNDGLNAANKTGTIEFMRDNCEVLANAYAKKQDFANAYKYQGMYIGYRDSMSNAQVTNQTNILQYNYD